MKKLEFLSSVFLVETHTNLPKFGKSTQLRDIGSWTRKKIFQFRKKFLALQNPNNKIC